MELVKVASLVQHLHGHRLPAPFGLCAKPHVQRHHSPRVHWCRGLRLWLALRHLSFFLFFNVVQFFILFSKAWNRFVIMNWRHSKKQYGDKTAYNTYGFCIFCFSVRGSSLIIFHRWQSRKMIWRLYWCDTRNWLMLMLMLLLLLLTPCKRYVDISFIQQFEILITICNFLFVLLLLFLLFAFFVCV